jgi:hypothetical protein
MIEYYPKPEQNESKNLLKAKYKVRNMLNLPIVNTKES